METRRTNSFVEEAISAHLADVQWDVLGSEAKEQAVRAILWWLMSALEGASESGQEPVARYVAGLGGSEEATIVGRSQRAPAELAGLVNGRAGKVWEHEDKWWANSGTGFAIGCTVVPAAIAAAEACGGVTGRELTTAVALGIDFGARILRPLGRGFSLGRSAANATFAIGNYAAAVSAGKIFSLDAEGFRNALGLAHAQASGSFQGHVEGRAVALQCGFVVRNGIAAARLAQGGVPGVRGSITGRAGLYALHYPNSRVDFDRVVERLGDELLGSRLGFKAYPCGVVAHPALDAVLKLRESVAIGSFDAIRVEGPTVLKIMSEPIERRRRPADAVEALFSLPWGVACVARDGALTVEHYHETRLQDAELRRLASMVEVATTEEARETSVTLLSNGRSVATASVAVARGHPLNPMPTEAMAELLRQAARRAQVVDGCIDDLPRRVLELESLDNVNDLTRAFAAAPE